MKPAANLIITSIVSLLVGMGLAIYGYEFVLDRANTQAAKAELYASGDALRTKSLVTAMTHAQRAWCRSPDSYDPQEAVGDIYSAMGNRPAAAESYESALKQLQSGGTKSMLVGGESVTTQTAAEHLKRKLEANRR